MEKAEFFRSWYKINLKDIGTSAILFIYVIIVMCDWIMDISRVISKLKAFTKRVLLHRFSNVYDLTMISVRTNILFK